MRRVKIVVGLALCAASGLWYLLQPDNTTWWLAGIPGMIGLMLLFWAGALMKTIKRQAGAAKGHTLRPQATAADHCLA